MYLYRTQVGIKIIDYVGGKYKKTLKFLSYAAVIFGYLLMTIMIYLLAQLVYIYVKNPEVVKAIKIPPLMPLIPYLPSLFKINFLPPFYFTYWIIAIAVIAVFHEFAHGILARYNNITIKTTGFGFLGPFLAAFVEPDEEQMQKKSKFAQISILSAGTFANLVLAIFFFLLLSGFFVLTYAPAGAMFNMYIPGNVSINDLEMIDELIVDALSNQEILKIIEENNITDDLVLGNGKGSIAFTRIIAGGKYYYITINNLKEQLKTENSYVILFEDLPAIKAGLKGVIIEVEENEIKTHEDLAEVMKKYKPGDRINIRTKIDKDTFDYNLVLAEDPNQKGRAIMGIGVIDSGGDRLIFKISRIFDFFRKPATNYEPRFNTDLIVFIYNLIWWLALVNISVALINMLPMGIFDGGRMFMLTIWGITGSEKAGKSLFKFATYLILGIFLLLMLSWVWAVF